MKTRLLVDATLISIGGGVQVGINLITNLIQDSDFEIILVASPQISNQLTNSQKESCLYFVEEKNESIWKKRAQGKRILEVEQKYNPDLVFVVFGPSYWRPKSLTLQGFALPLMVYPATRNKIYKSNFYHYFYQKILNVYKAVLMKRNSDFVVVETETFKDRVHDFLKIPKDKIYVIENSFNANFNNKEFSKNLISIHEKINIFIPTAYYPHKNLEILVDVAAVLKNLNFTSVEFNFLIETKSEIWNKIILEAKNKGVQSFFKSYGPVNNVQMKELYAKCDFVLLPTLAEASTAVYPESFISEKVLLTSDIDFARELCGDAAIFFDPHNPIDIANKIIEIFSDQEKQANLISNGLKQLEVSYISPENKWLKQKSLLLSLKESH